MRISLTTSGGWGAGLRLGRPPRVLDSTTLADDDARRLGELVTAALAEVPPPDPSAAPPAAPPAPDAASYRLDIDGGDVGAAPASLRASDADMTEAFSELLAYVEERASDGPAE